MKKIICILLLVGTSCYGQSKDFDFTKNRTEIKLNTLALIEGGFEFEVERTINSKSSVGLSAFKAYEDDHWYGHDSSIAAFYRLYFGKKYASGFYLEGFGMLNTEKYLFSSGILPNGTESRGYRITNDFALGLGLGYKWVSKKGLILQSNFGVGRNLVNANDLYGDEFVGKAGILIGFGF